MIEAAVFPLQCHWLFLPASEKAQETNDLVTYKSWYKENLYDWTITRVCEICKLQKRNTARELASFRLAALSSLLNRKGENIIDDLALSPLEVEGFELLESKDNLRSNQKFSRENVMGWSCSIQLKCSILKLWEYMQDVTL